MRSLRIGVDMDGTTAQWTENFAQWVHHTTGRPLASLPVTAYHDIAAEWCLGPSEFERLFAAGIAAEVTFRTEPLHHHADRVLRHLHDLGHQLVVVTDRDRFCLGDIARDSTTAWLDDNNIPFHELHLTGDKTGLDLDILIDDLPHNVEAIRDEGGVGLLMSRPWNTTADPQLPRITGWDHAAATIINHANPTLVFAN